ncbi:hypothetical protein I317_03679 [Kwoniella heveanensis CBS 569]|nr:hypothetical protein I317_03679 [Kwoniella heveanensis CBS 569]
MLSLKTLFAATALASTVYAHFTLDYPTSRGFDDDNEPQFCGGFNSVETRQPFPLGQGPVHIDSHHNLATVVAFISTSSNPTSFDDFNTTSNGTSIPLATDFFQVTSGDKCFNVNLGALGLGLTNGSEVTLQIQYDGGDGNLYQCADLVLIDGYSVPSNETCTSDAATAGNATSSATTGGSSSTVASGSSSATSAAATTSSASGGSSGAFAQKETVGWGLAGAVMGIATLLVL